MSRLILIDRSSGYIWGDTADYARCHQGALTPAIAANLLHRSLQEEDAAFVETHRTDTTAVYDVLEDRGQDRSRLVIEDGQDQATISAVWSGCDHVATLCRAGP